MEHPVSRPDSDETARLLVRIADGERAAADKLLARHRKELRAFVDLHLDAGVRARVDPSDVVQETHAVLAKRLPDFLRRRPMPFHLWAKKTAYERLLNAGRKHRAKRRDVKREVKQPDRSSAALVQSILCTGPSPSEVAKAKELAEHVAAVVAKLSDLDREILLLRQVQELPYEEVAVLLNIDATAARQRYGRALMRLQRRLKKQGLLEKTV